MSTECIYVLCVNLVKNRLFSIESLTGFYNRDKFIYCAVQSGSLNITRVNFHP